MKAALAALAKATPRDPDTFVLPHNIEAERATLGAALTYTPAADYIIDRLRPEAYFRRVHQHLFAAIRTMRDERTAIDFVTLKDYLRRRGKLEEIGGAVYIAQLADQGAARNVAHYVDILVDLQIKRALVGHANRTIDLVAAAAHGAPAILEDADRRLLELQAGHIEGRMQSLEETASALYADLEFRVAHKGELTGVTTGFASLNEMTLGWQAGDLIIIGARPSIGKTTFVVNSAVHGALAGKRYAIFSLEMRRRQLEYRMLAQLADVPLSRILGGHIGDPDYPKIAAAMSTMAGLPIHIDDTAGRTVGDVRAACRRLKAAGGLDAVIVDYVQLMTGSVDRRGATRNEELTDISRRLKVLADELAVPILVLSQLTRENEKRPDPRPRLSDLRESGALEQDADLVCFLHRKSHREGGVTNFIFEKQRNGPTGTVNLTLVRDVTTFLDGGEEPVEAPKPAKEPKPAPAKKKQAAHRPTLLSSE